MCGSLDWSVLMAFGNYTHMSNTSRFQHCCERLARNTAERSGRASLLSFSKLQGVGLLLGEGASPEPLQGCLGGHSLSRPGVPAGQTAGAQGHQPSAAGHLGCFYNATPRTEPPCAAETPLTPAQKQDV